MGVRPRAAKLLYKISRGAIQEISCWIPSDTLGDLGNRLVEDRYRCRAVAILRKTPIFQESEKSNFFYHDCCYQTGTSNTAHQKHGAHSKSTTQLPTELFMYRSTEFNKLQLMQGNGGYASTWSRRPTNAWTNFGQLGICHELMMLGWCHPSSSSGGKGPTNSDCKTHWN